VRKLRLPFLLAILQGPFQNSRIAAVGSPENLINDIGENASLNDVFLEKVKTPEEQAGFNSTQFRNLLRRR